MTPNEQKLWLAIEQFEIDIPGTALPYSKKLAQENDWDKQTTQRVIEEYKKFIFLCCVSEKMVSPSHMIDEAWHLHMLYSKSYWIDFCKNTLGQNIHHTPSNGGQQERDKHKGMFEYTLKLYTQYFGSQPPMAIWSVDCKKCKNVVKTNKNYWNLSIPKPSYMWDRMVLSTWKVAFTAPLALFFVQASGEDVFIDFLTMIMVLLIFGIIFISLVGGNKKKKKKGSSGSGSSTTTDDSVTTTSWFWFSSNDSDSSGDSGCSSCSSCGGCGGCGG